MNHTSDVRTSRLDRDGPRRTPMARRTWLAAVCVAGLVLAACSGDGSAADAPEAPAGTEYASADDAEDTGQVDESSDAWLLYQAVFEGDVDLGLVRVDGSDAHRIPGGPGNRWHPDWSPDGTTIAYDHGLPDGRAEIRLVDIDGDDDRLVVGCDDPCLGQAGPAWSPDGRTIGFDGYEGPTDGLDVERCYLAAYDLDNDEVRRILEWPGCDQDEEADDRELSEGIYMRFRPDGERIVFQGEGPRGEWAIFTAAIDGDDVQQLTDWDAGARPDWSPDGEWIVFQGQENEPPDIRPRVAVHRIRPDGSDLEQLTEPEGQARDYYPRFLPDGSGIIYNRCETLLTCEARVVTLDGSDDRLLLAGLGDQTGHFMLQPSDQD